MRAKAVPESERSNGNPGSCAVRIVRPNDGQALGSFVPTDIEEQSAWETALQRFRDAKEARDDWNTQNPHPGSEGFEDHRAKEVWEKDHETVNQSFCDAIDAIRAIPAPNLHGVIVKLQLIRFELSGLIDVEVEAEFEPLIRAIESDIERLVMTQGGVSFLHTTPAGICD